MQKSKGCITQVCYKLHNNNLILVFKFCCAQITKKVFCFVMNSCSERILWLQICRRFSNPDRKQRRKWAARSPRDHLLSCCFLIGPIDPEARQSEVVPSFPIGAGWTYGRLRRRFRFRISFPVPVAGTFPRTP